MIRCLLFSALVGLCFSPAVNASKTRTTADNRPDVFSKTALLVDEGGCVFITEEGFPHLTLEFADYTGDEKKVAGDPVKDVKQLESALGLCNA